MGIDKDDIKQFADKAKAAVSENRDKVEDKAEEVIDKVVKGDNATKVKNALREGLDKLTGK